MMTMMRMEAMAREQSFAGKPQDVAARCCKTLRQSVAASSMLCLLAEPLGRLQDAWLALVELQMTTSPSSEIQLRGGAGSEPQAKVNPEAPDEEMPIVAGSQRASPVTCTSGSRGGNWGSLQRGVTCRGGDRCHSKSPLAARTGPCICKSPLDDLL